MSGYNFFSKERLSVVKKENPDKQQSDIMKLVGKEWSGLSDSAKKKYTNMSKADKVRHVNEMKLYEPKRLEKEAALKAMPKSNTEQQGSKKQKKDVDPNKPKRGKSAYLFYCEAQRPIVTAANPEAKNKEIMTMLGQGWSKLSDKQKIPYDKKGNAEKARYLEEMKGYTPPVGAKRKRASSNVAIEAGAKKKVKASKTAFQFYCDTGKRDKYSKKNPNASEAALIDILREKFNAMPSDRMAKYTDMVAGGRVEL